MKELLDRMFVFAPEGKEAGADETDQEANTPETKDEPEPKDETQESVPYARFKEVNDRLKEATGAIKKLQQAEDERKTKSAEEQGKFEELYTGEKAKREEAEAQLLKMTVGLEAGLPLALIGRLQGSSEEELKADAEQLIALVPEGERVVRDTPPADPRRKKTTQLDISNMSPEEIRKHSAKLLEDAGVG